MKIVVGDWVIEDTVTVFYLIFVIAIILAWVFVTVMMVVLFWKEMKDSFIDVLRVIQYVATFIRFLTLAFSYMWYFWKMHSDNLYFQNVLEFLDGIGYYYPILNFLTWYLLMYQIKILYQLRNGGSFQDCK